MEALAENCALEELNLAANTCSDEVNSLSLNFNGSLNSLHADRSLDINLLILAVTNEISHLQIIFNFFFINY